MVLSFPGHAFTKIYFPHTSLPLSRSVFFSVINVQGYDPERSLPFPSTRLQLKGRYTYTPRDNTFSQMSKQRKFPKKGNKERRDRDDRIWNMCEETTSTKWSLATCACSSSSHFPKNQKRARTYTSLVQITHRVVDVKAEGRRAFFMRASRPGHARLSCR